MRRSIRGSSLRRSRKREEGNPMDGLANLADAMLVLACGLMMALMIHWNVDIKWEQVDLSLGAEVTDVENQNMIQAEQTGDSYQKMGTLYRDPQSGKLYMLTEESNLEGQGTENTP